MSQSALSQGVQQLERTIGSPLTERVGRGHRLTPVGEATLVFARRVLAETDRLGAQLTARRDGKAGNVRLGLVDAAALYLLKEPLERFRAGHPEVYLQLTVETSARLLTMVEQFELDAAIVIGPPDETRDAEEGYREIIREPLYVYGPPIDDLTHARRWVLYPDQSRTRSYIDQALSSLGVTPVVRNECSNPSVIAQLVRLGEGWTVLPAGIADSVVNPLPRRSGVIAERRLVAVKAKHAQTDPLVDHLLTWLAPEDGEAADTFHE